MRNNQVNFGDILPEISKSSAFWVMGVSSHLKWLLLFNPYEAGEWGRPQSNMGLDASEYLDDGFVRKHTY